ncbi:hypothetical protein [Desulfovibrio sp. JC010]|uniref:hypothetical protein n=1 Tax=Desulfovibrio sp. JC010 TaxID=2593641 RepID=UPI0013D60A11|nr:hypothetical protein [Desulfovibrio sp. JC010]NDV26917.1 hypothetical protein [Desulfovibrio sp. JC010]
MRSTSQTILIIMLGLIVLTFLLGTLFFVVPAFAEDLADLNPAGELLIDVDTGNATSSVNATAPIAQANATNTTANSNVANGTSITAFMTDSNSTDKDQKPEAPASAENATATPAQTTAPEATEQVAQHSSTFARPAVSLGDANHLRNLIEYRNLQVKLAKKEKELLELSIPDPALITPKKQEAKPKKKRCPAWPKVVSIQGVDGRLSATLSSSAGIETVRVGNTAGPGKVVSITPNKVLVRTNGKNVALKFKE